MRRILGEWAYKNIREYVIRKNKHHRYASGLGDDLEVSINDGDRALTTIPEWLHPLLFYYPIPRAIDVDVCGLTFPSPLCVSSFKDDHFMIDMWLRLGMGGACFKTIMMQPRKGNDRPRIQEFKYAGYDGLINAMGLPGKGVKAFLNDLEEYMTSASKKPIGISIGGESVTEYLDVFRHVIAYVHKQHHPMYIELNLSCPNTKEGQDMLKDLNLLEALIRSMRNESCCVISVKLSPDQSNGSILAALNVLQGFENIMVNIGNTSYRRCEDVGLLSEDISIGGGGISGPSLFPRTLELTKLAAPLNIPIIATGGVTTARQVIQLLEKGASLIGLASVLVTNPYIVPKMNYYVDQWRRKMNGKC